MNQAITHGAQAELWQALVHEAGERVDAPLDETRESYLCSSCCATSATTPCWRARRRWNGSRRSRRSAASAPMRCATSAIAAC